MLGSTRRIHFVGIGGIGMSGIAELLANLGYEVSGSDARRSDVDGAAGAEFGVTVFEGHAAGERRRRGGRGVLVGGAADEPGDRRGDAARHPGDPARRDAGRADAAAVRDRGRRLARQDDDDVDDRAGARAGRARSDGGDRRAAERVRQQRAARTRRVPGGGSGRKRSVVPEAVAVDCGGDQHRSRAHGELRELRRPAAGVRGLREQGAVLRRRRRVRRRRRALPRCFRASSGRW